MMERYHRFFKAVLMCSPHIPWSSLLPSGLLDLRTAFKEDLHASPADLVFGAPLRLPGEFLAACEDSLELHAFLISLREHFRTLKLVQTSYHTTV